MNADSTVSVFLTMTRPPMPRLPDMPFHIKQLIVSNVDFPTRCSLETCSKEFCNLVKRCPVDYETVQVKLVRSTKYKICVTDRHGIYEYSRVKRSGELQSDFRRRVFTYLRLLFRNYDSRVRNFLIHTMGCHDEGVGEYAEYDEVIDEFHRQMIQLGHQLDCKRLQLDWFLYGIDLQHLFPHFRPGNLEKIDITPHDGALDPVSDFGMEQLNQAKWINFNYVQDVSEVCIYPATFVRLVEPHTITYEQLKFVVKKWMEPSANYRMLRMKYCYFADDTIVPRILTRFNALEAANGTFIILPWEGYLKISRSTFNFILRVLPASMSNRWPKDVLDEEEENESDHEESVFDSDEEDYETDDSEGDDSDVESIDEEEEKEEEKEEPNDVVNVGAIAEAEHPEEEEVEHEQEIKNDVAEGEFDDDELEVLDFLRDAAKKRRAGYENAVGNQQDDQEEDNGGIDEEDVYDEEYEKGEAELMDGEH